MSGRLELILGPMFASKSTELIRIANRYLSIGKKILVINHSINNRYGGSNNITTHDEVKFGNILILDNLKAIISHEKFDESEIILIEELQFFEDKLEIIPTLVDKYNKVVIGVGLDGDYKKNSFGGICDLIPHAEEITKLNAFCSVCKDGTKAYFTKKIVDSDEQILVGSNNEYIPVCRKHYNEK